MKSKMFWVGLGLQILNLIGIGAFVFQDKISELSFGMVVIGGMYIAINITSFAFMLVGAKKV